MGAYLAVVLAVDDLSFIRFRAVIVVLKMDPLHCAVVDAGWVRVQCVQCVHEQPVTRCTKVTRREEGGGTETQQANRGKQTDEG